MEDLVRMEDRIAAINNLVDINSDGVQLIRIYGIGSIGKTTLAQKIYKQLYLRFGKSCGFLDDIREMAKTNGLVELQLLSDFSNPGVASNIHKIDHGIERIGDAKCNKKVLIRLDDVDEDKQIENLVGIIFLYLSTRILVTIREKIILRIREFEYEIVSYEMEGLCGKDALQLFSKHAFNDNYPPTDYYTFSKDIVEMASKNT